MNEALPLFRRLASQDLETYEPVLAAVLYDYAKHRDADGHPGDAVAPAKESVLLFRRAFERDTESYRKPLCEALFNHGKVLLKVLRAEALQPLFKDKHKRAAVIAEARQVLQDCLELCEGSEDEGYRKARARLDQVLDTDNLWV